MTRPAIQTHAEQRNCPLRDLHPQMVRGGGSSRSSIRREAQREACEAFIDSQRHEGWVRLRAGYDDGGWSGATMERPALQQLLADITAGRIAIVVVYKTG